MAEYVRRHWEARFQGMTRRDRRGCDYSAYLPDTLAGWHPTLPTDLAADIADAEAAIRDLNARGTRHVSLEGLARFLLRAESVASSKIEGLDAGPRRLLNVEAVLEQGGEPADRIAVEVIGNIAAMESAIDIAVRKERLSVVDVLEIHRVLMDRSAKPETGGVVREQQNWIGGSSYNPCSAAYVPPPPEDVADLLRDLMHYAGGDDHSALVQAAIAHAQFETIHPFVDGNGRTGRALVHVILRRRGLAPSFVPPISLVLATRSTDYVAGLTAYRYDGPADGPERSAAARAWLHTFASATLRACLDAEAYASRINELVESWRADLGRVRKASAADLLIEVLPGVPLLTVESAARLIARSTVAASAAVNRLVDAGILVQRNVGRQRYRVFEAPGVVDLFTSLERALASPTGDTAVAPPVRHVARQAN
jgi:Fic family protein